MGSIDESQIGFYLKKYREFGDDPRSLSFNDKGSQYLRFERIADLFRHEKGMFSVHEVGCGLGHFKEYLDAAGRACEYSGCDIVPDFIDKGREKFPGCRFFLQNIGDDYRHIDEGIKGKDYYCLNGTFNPKEDATVEEWETFVFKSIENMYRMARKGICFNFLTSYSDFYDDKLYYADPLRIMDWSIRHLSRFVSVSQDTPLYEFFVYVYKKEFVKGEYPGYEKYFRGVP